MVKPISTEPPPTIGVSGGTKDGRKCYVIFTLEGCCPSWVVVDSPIEVSGGTEDGRP